VQLELEPLPDLRFDFELPTGNNSLHARAEFDKHIVAAGANHLAGNDSQSMRAMLALILPVAVPVVSHDALESTF